MSRLADIPIAVEGAPAPRDPDGGLGGGVVAVLHEVATLLERLHESGTPSTIDLKTMPMSPSDHQQLREALGEGEVSAEIAAEGPSRIRETGTHGVWWIEHRDARDNLLAEFLEITTVPEFLCSHRADVEAAVGRLRRRIASAADTGAKSGGEDDA